MDKLVPFIIEHNKLMITYLIWGILVLMAFWILYIIFRKEESQSAKDKRKDKEVTESLKNVEKLIGKLENRIVNEGVTVSGAMATVAVAASTSDQATVNNGSIGQPENQTLVEAQLEIESLKKSLEKYKSEGGAGSDSADLLNKIKDLEARLFEYEIIEEDIADLSRYREENEKLKQEIEILKNDKGLSVAPNNSNQQETKSEDIMNEVEEDSDLNEFVDENLEGFDEIVTEEEEENLNFSNDEDGLSDEDLLASTLAELDNVEVDDAMDSNSPVEEPSEEPNIENENISLDDTNSSEKDLALAIAEEASSLLGGEFDFDSEAEPLDLEASIDMDLMTAEAQDITEKGDV